MSHFRRVVFVMTRLLSVLMLIVIITNLIAPVMSIAETHNLGPFQGAFNMIQTVTYWVLVPLFGVPLIAYLIFGPAEEERQRKRRRRRL